MAIGIGILIGLVVGARARGRDARRSPAARGSRRRGGRASCCSRRPARGRGSAPRGAARGEGGVGPAPRGARAGREGAAGGVAPASRSGWPRREAELERRVDRARAPRAGDRRPRGARPPAPGGAEGGEGPGARRARAGLRDDRQRGEGRGARSARRSSSATSSPGASGRWRRRRSRRRGAAPATSSPTRSSGSPRATRPRRRSRSSSFPSDDMKGRIIGREGRNIRTLEHLTGVDIIIDDTPGAVVLSSFDGIRREVAKITLTKLIEDGRIHPARIEEMYYQSKAELDDHIRQAGEQAVFEANCGEFPEEIVKILGRLRYRTSYGQNVLKHTLEVVQLVGIMASELDASVKTAKRAALLHDLGKALTHEVEGSHALISAQYARRYGETPGRRARDRGAPLRGAAADGRGGAPDRRRRDLRVAAGRPRREPRGLHQAARVARGARRPDEGRRQGLRAPRRPRDPRDRQAGGDRRRRRPSCSRTRSPARSRSTSSTRVRSR